MDAKQKNEERVRDILERFGEDMSATWMVQSTRVIYHQAVERIAAKAGILFEEPTVLRAERDEAVILVRGRLGDRWDYDVGEALVNVNYRVSGKQAAYVWAMALKRGRDRLVLKLIGVHGLIYSEDEADSFKESAPPANNIEEVMQEAVSWPTRVRPVPVAFANRVADSIPARDAVMQEAVKKNVTVSGEDGEVSPFSAMRRMIDQKMTVTALSEFMLKPETSAAIAAWSEEERSRVREYARNRLLALGWKSNAGTRA
jgi:hypothetical protein